MPSKILITGGTGLVGRRLQEKLRKKGYTVSILTTSSSRTKEKGYFYWNTKDQYLDPEAFEGVEHLIHLAGAGVADKRWSKKRKKELRDSRIQSTTLLVKKAKDNHLKTVVAASAIGLYGFNTGENLLEEESQYGKDFLATLVKDWEKETAGFEAVSDRVVSLRIGIVLSTLGGALKAMSWPFKMGLGSPIGSGKQWMSWIHIDDLAEIIIYALESKIKGTYNAVAPTPETNKRFSRILAQTFKKPFFLPHVPGFVLRILFGELASIVLGGNKISSKKIEKSGFRFEFPKLSEALKNLIHENR